MRTPRRIVIIIAGTNEPSNAASLALYFVKGMKKHLQSATIDEFRLKDMHIEHFTLKHYETNTDQGKDFKAIKQAVEKADALVIATPIWNFSVPAHLKNLIDRMGSFALDSSSRSLGMLNGKPVYLLYTGGSPSVVWTGLQRRTLSHMPVSLRYFGLTVIGSHYEERCTLGKGRFGLVVDKRKSTEEIVGQKGASFAKIVDYYARTGKLPFRQWILKHIFQSAQRVKRKLGI